MTSEIMNEQEEAAVQAQVDKMMTWAQTNQAEAQQLALDATQLLRCSTDRINNLQRQSFFKRCYFRLTGKTGEIERLNQQDLRKLQGIALKYLGGLQEQQILMAHAVTSVHQMVLSVSKANNETKKQLNDLAISTERLTDRVNDNTRRINNLETRTSILEIRQSQLESRADYIEEKSDQNDKIHDWLNKLKYKEYNKKFPSENIRIFQIITEYCPLKQGTLEEQDEYNISKAIDDVGIKFNKTLSISDIVSSLVDEIKLPNVGYAKFEDAILQGIPSEINNVAQFVEDTISSPIFRLFYNPQLQKAERVSSELGFWAKLFGKKSDADKLKEEIINEITQENVDVHRQFTAAQLTMHLLGCLKLLQDLVVKVENNLDVVPIAKESGAKNHRIATKEELIQARTILAKSTHENINYVLNAIENTLNGTNASDTWLVVKDFEQDIPDSWGYFLVPSGLYNIPEDFSNRYLSAIVGLPDARGNPPVFVFSGQNRINLIHNAVTVFANVRFEALNPTVIEIYGHPSKYFYHLSAGSNIEIVDGKSFGLAYGRNWALEEYNDEYDDTKYEVIPPIEKYDEFSRRMFKMIDEIRSKTERAIEEIKQRIEEEETRSYKPITEEQRKTAATMYDPYGEDEEDDEDDEDDIYAE